MKAIVSKEGTHALLRLEGRLDTAASQQVSMNIDEQLATLGHVDGLVCDATGLEYISSSGLRVLLAAAKVMEQNQGTVKVTEPNESVMEVFELTGFDTVFNIG
jgi:anti-sigma B factor antagonist